MATKLAPLRSRLTTLRRRRWTQRVIHGAIALTLLLLAALGGDFLLDWLLAFSRPQRIFVLGLLGALLLWGLRRFLWPALAARETDLEMALLVERCHGIDSDLVAALQFEESGAPAWGSLELEAAVVNRVANFGNRLDVSRGLPRGRAGGVGFALACLASIYLAGSAIFPDHARTFFDRLLLGSAHYPTRTHITRVVVNGSSVEDARSTTWPKVPFGAAVHFAVDAVGICPESGAIRVVPDAGGEAVALKLAPLAPPDNPPTADDRGVTSSGDLREESKRSYTAELARLTEKVRYQVFLGDAWTEPAVLEVIPPPAVSLELEYSPPDYAARGRAATTATSSRQISVIEGSHVGLTIRCDNKPLATVDLVVAGVRFPLEPQDGRPGVWMLPETGTPLARVVTPVAFEVAVVDADGIAPEAPLRGHIRIEADRPPRIAAAVVTEKVLPTARPGVTWGAADDYGLAEVRVYQQVIRTTGKIEQSVDVVQKIDPSQPRKALRGRRELDFAPLGLGKGDQVRVTLEVVDYRGDQPGTAVQSEPVVFQVTDESGILAGLVEADEKSARQLDEIIQRQLGAGESAR